MPLTPHSTMKSVHLPASVQTEEEFKWAMGMVKAKAVVLDGQVVLQCSACAVCAVQKRSYPHPLLLLSLPSSFPPSPQVTLLPGMDYISFDPLSTSEPYTASAGIFGGKVRTVRAGDVHLESSPTLRLFCLVLCCVCVLSAC
jgi:hypothetical protein